MTNNKQQTAVDFAFETLANQGLLVYKEYTNLVAYQEAKEMQKERMIQFAKQFIDVVNIEDKDIENIYNETYGGGEQ
jgi:hypothetical protein